MRTHVLSRCFGQYFVQTIAGRYQDMPEGFRLFLELLTDLDQVLDRLFKQGGLIGLCRSADIGTTRDLGDQLQRGPLVLGGPD